MGQCVCTDCPVQIISNNTTSSTITIQGAANDQLGVNGQGVCQVCVNFVHDAIEEVDFFLISPSGSTVQLIENTGVSVNDNITFDICFVACSQQAQPDPGFPPVFDSGAGWVNNQIYTGSYYPFDPACLESFTGAVNGNWTLEMTDNIFLDDGTLFDWYLVFNDDTGIGCANAGACGPPCLADAGFVQDPPDTFCVGDPGLLLDIEPFYDGINSIQPPANAYGYTWLISETGTNAPVLEVTPVPDLTTYGPGTYAICGYSYLLSEGPPVADGVLTKFDLATQIQNGDLCADVWNICFILTVEDAPPLPDLTGPASVCAGSLVQYVINNYDPAYTTTYVIQQGSVDFFTANADIIDVIWSNGPAELCALFETSCGMALSCIQIDVANPATPAIAGAFEVCQGDIQTYSVTPAPGTTETYDFQVTGGNIIGQTANSATIEWTGTGTGEICASLNSPGCPPSQSCVPIVINSGSLLPNMITSPDAICSGNAAIAEIPPDPGIIAYDWSATGATILSGQGTSLIELSADNPGTVDICIEITTNCGVEGPLCKQIEVFQQPNPVINPVPAGCQLDINLDVALTTNGQVNWSQSGGPPGVIFSSTSQPQVQATLPGPGIYTIEVTETSNLCTGTDEIVVEVLDGLQVSPLIFDCDINGMYTVTFDLLNGQAPFTVNGEQLNSNMFTSDPLTSGETYTFDVTDALGCAIFLSDTYVCPCLSDAGTMAGGVLEVCGASGEEATGLSNGDATLDGNDIGIFILHDSPTGTPGIILDQNETGVFSFLPGMTFGEVYYISYVVGNASEGSIDLTDPCLSVAEGQPVIFYAFPTVAIDVAGTTCNPDFEVGGTLSGDITEISWSQVAGPGTSAFSSVTAFPVNISVSQPGIYTYALEVSNGFCTDVLEIDIEVASVPELIPVTEQCDSTTLQYVLVFDVIGGLPPFEANIQGVFAGNTFTSDPISSGEQYDVTVTDANGCQSSVLSGSRICTCITTAGNMAPSEIRVCGFSDTVEAVAPGNPVLDDNDTVVYILHTAPTASLGTVIQISATGIFTFEAGMQAGVRYYISQVVGNASASGIDLSDPCLDVAAGQPVVWYALPQPTINGPLTSCRDTIQLSAIPETGTWRVISSPDGSDPQIADPAGFNTDLIVDRDGDYGIEWTTQSNGCIARDTAVFTRLPLPQIINQQETCLGNLTQYVFSFEVTGPDSLYYVNGVPLTGPFVSAPLDTDTTHSFVISGSNGCTEVLSTGPLTCDCISDAGTIMTETRLLCAGDPLDVLISNNDFTLDENDTLVYVLHDGTDVPLGNILAISSGEPVVYNNAFSPGQEYQLNIVVTSFDNDTIHLDDPCLSVSDFLPVVWNPANDIFVDDTLSACIGDSVYAQVQVSGQYPVNLTFVNADSDTVEVLLGAPSDVVPLYVESDIEAWQLIDAEGLCIRQMTGQIVLSGTSPLDVILESDIVLCSQNPFGTQIPLEDLFSSLPVPGAWSAPDLFIENDTLSAEGIDPGVYSITFSTIGFEPQCPGNIWTTTIEVVDCLCPDVQLPDTIFACNQAVSLDLNTYIPPGLHGFWTVDAPSSSNPVEVDGAMLTIQDKDPGIYPLVFELTDSLPDGCQLAWSTAFVLEGQPFAGIQVVFPEVCVGTDSTIVLSELLSDADPSGLWYAGDSMISPAIGLAAFESGIHLFRYVIPPESTCDTAVSEVFISILSEPDYFVTAEDLSCFGLDDGRISFTIQEPVNPPYTYFLNGMAQNGPDLQGLAPGIYTVGLMDDNQCVREIDSIEIGQPEPVTVFLGADRAVKIDTEVRIEAITNILSTDVAEIRWEDLSGVLEGEDLVLIRSFVQDNVIEIFIEDTNGCVATDDLRITTVSEGLYVPNVINPGSDNPANRQFSVAANPLIESIEIFSIYDRWGNLVFRTENMQPGTDGAIWDGTFNGRIVLPGVYVYDIRIRLQDGRFRRLTGDVTVVR